VNAESTFDRRGVVTVGSRALANFVGTILGQGLLVLLIVVVPQGGDRAVALVLFLLGSPALALYLRLRSEDALSAFIIAGTAAVVVNAVVAEVMVTTGMWSISVGAVAIAVIGFLLAVIGYASAVAVPRRLFTDFACTDASEET
jgi:hypothetical protein